MDSYKNDIFEALKKKCYDFMNSKYILSQIRIKAILEWIVINPSLYDFVKKCSIGIDYRYELNKLIENGFSKLPLSNRYIITIVIGLLYDLDNGNISLSSVLRENFFEQDTEASFLRFNQTLIVPFIDAVATLYINGTDPLIDDSLEEEKKHQQRKVDFTYLIKILNPDLKELNTFIQGDNSIDDEKRNEYTIMVEGLLHALSISDVIMIKACYTGLKNTVKNNKNYRSRLQNIENYLLKFSVI